MGITNEQATSYINNSVGRVFSFDEAIEFSRFVEKYGTPFNRINWVDTKTKKSVIIGYNGR